MKNNLTDIILHNDKKKYSQGVFANNIERIHLYELARNIVLPTKNEELYLAMLKEFLIKTLQWGDYDKIVGRYRRTNSEKIIYNIPNFREFGLKFHEILSKDNPDFKLIFDQFNSDKILKVQGIGFAYFTKFIHFYCSGRQLSNLPLIFDKWMIILWSAYMIENDDVSNNKTIQQILRVDNKKNIVPVYLNIDGSTYNSFILYLDKIAKSLKLDNNRLEELLFGWDLRKQKSEFVNTRYKAKELILHYFDSLK